MDRRPAARPPGRERYLGIDPGLIRTGFGVIDREGTRLTYVASGVIRIPTQDALPARLASLFAQVCEVAQQYRPHAAAIEQVFVNVNPRSTLLLGQARGAAIAALASEGLSVAEYTPGQIKQAVVGYGRATKLQVQAMVMRLLALPAAPSPDAADALACASCHAQGLALIGALARSGAPAPGRRRGRLGRS